MKTKNKHSLIYLITAFVLAQIAWFALLGLWIYWYVANYLIFEQVGNQLSPKLTIDNPSVLIFVLGIVLMVGIETAMVFTFRNLTVQIKITGLYDNFIGNVSHELKSPLSSIQLYLETLLHKDVNTEKRNEFLNLMLNDVSRLNKLISTILEIPRLEQKKIAHDYRVYEANKIFNEIIFESANQFNFPAEDLAVHNDVECKCVIDKIAIKIVFDNLFSNSIKYARTRPVISVEIKNNENQIEIKFSDDGIGIVASELKKMFSKFHRIANTNAPNVKGTGLGLYWTKEIIKLHGGDIKVFSDGENQGTTFKIEIPVYNSYGKKFVNSLLKRSQNQNIRNESNSDEFE